jgi:hypothetical protein
VHERKSSIFNIGIGYGRGTAINKMEFLPNHPLPPEINILLYLLSGVINL